MAFVLNDRVLETSTVTGTGPATLLGASSGFQSFATGIGASNTTYYCIVNPAVASEWEVGFGTLDATGAILTRTTVYRSSNAGSAVVFTAGTKTVFVTYPSSRSVNYASDSSLAITGATTFASTVGVNSTATVTTATNSALTINNGGTGTPLTNSVASFFGNVNSFSQLNYQNLNAGNNASTDFVATADNGTDSTNFVNFGINSSTYNLGTFTITGANDGYMFSQSSNLAIGTGAAATSVKFFQGGTLAANEVARFAPTTNNLLVGTTSDGAGTAKVRVAGVIESTTGGVRFPNGVTQTTAFAVTAPTINIGTTPIQSSTYVIADATVTTASNISIVPNARTNNTLIAVGAITGGSAYTNGTYNNVPLTGGTGTGAVAATVVVSTGAISSVTMPNAVGAVILGTITAGSGYTNGTYLNVPLTGGAGTGAVATSITVAGGVVTAVVLPTTGVGAGYVATNVLTASNTFLGGAGSAFAYTLTQVSSLGINYAYGDTLGVLAANVGGTGSGFSTPVALLSGGGDELEMDGIKASAWCSTNGLINVYIDASPGYIAGGRTFAYTLG
jgi:hypothetical protein